MYKKGDARADYCFAHQTYCFFDVFVDVAVVVTKAPF